MIALRADLAATEFGGVSALGSRARTRANSARSMEQQLAIRLIAQGLGKVCTRQAVFLVHCGGGYTEMVGDLLELEAAKKMQFHNLTLSLVDFRKFMKSFIDDQELVRIICSCDFIAI